MSLDIITVRELAEFNNYEEIDHNTTSRLISFRNGGTRINVYYTTGTVGTCLNHPKRGKTQLFRRNVDFEQLNDIFENPRSHTGKGYYRKRMDQMWKSAKDGSFVSDSARRWEFVATASGLTKNQSEIESIKKVMTLFDKLLWIPGASPYIGYDDVCTNFACGSVSSLNQILNAIVKEIYGKGTKCYDRSPFSDNSMISIRQL